MARHVDRTEFPFLYVFDLKTLSSPFLCHVCHIKVLRLVHVWLFSLLGEGHKSATKLHYLSQVLLQAISVASILKPTCPSPDTNKHFSMSVCPFWPSWAPIRQCHCMTHHATSCQLYCRSFVKLKADMKEYQHSTVRHEFHGTAPFLNHNTLPFLISDFYKFQGNCVFSHIGAELIFYPLLLFLVTLLHL